MVNHPAKFGDVMKVLLGNSGRLSSGAATSRAGGQRKRGIHTHTYRVRKQPPIPVICTPSMQKRTLYIRENLAFDLLEERGISTSEKSRDKKKRLLAIAVDRSTRSPCILASPAGDSDCVESSSKSFPFDYQTGPEYSHIPAIAKHLQLEGSSKDALPGFINDLVQLYTQKEAFLLRTLFVEDSGDLKVVNARFGFDDAAFRSAKRQADVHALRRTEDENAQEVEAEKDGIVYIKLAGNGNIGTLVYFLPPFWANFWANLCANRSQGTALA